MMPLQGPKRVKRVDWWSSRAGWWVVGSVFRLARSCRAWDSVDRRSCSWRRRRVLGAGGHLRMQKVVGLVGFERR